jgi:hypothetical protein
MLGRDGEWVRILKVVVGAQGVGIEALEMGVGRSVASVEGAFGGG